MKRFVFILMGFSLNRLLTYFPHDYAGGVDAESLGNDLSIWIPSIYGPKLTDQPGMMHLYGWAITAADQRA
jgi:hypothetical protein